MIQIGFSGSRHGMSEYQKENFIYYIATAIEVYGNIKFHHGDCVGADAEAHDIVTEQFAGNSVITIHPPLRITHRAFCGAYDMKVPRPYLVRNKNIVNSTNFLVATPQRITPVALENTGGTWYTIRYAESRNKSIVVLKREESDRLPLKYDDRPSFKEKFDASR